MRELQRNMLKILIYFFGIPVSFFVLSLYSELFQVFSDFFRNKSLARVLTGYKVLAAAVFQPILTMGSALQEETMTESKRGLTLQRKHKKAGGPGNIPVNSKNEWIAQPEKLPFVNRNGEQSLDPSPVVLSVDEPEPAIPVASTKNVGGATPASPSSPIRKVEAGDEFTLQNYYDRTSEKFVGFVAEIPEIRTTGKRRAEVMTELEEKLDSHLEILRRRGENLPESFQTRRYPEKLEVPISQGLYRKLDFLSRQEKVAIDPLVTELLSAGIERRHEMRGQKSPSQQPQTGNQRPSRPLSQPHHHRSHQGPRGRNIHDTLGNRENFMEYVRNLEKGGWKKR